MQHNIDTSQHGAHANSMVNAIGACVHCGLCLSACPTYQVLGEEMDSPRGRIYLMKAVLERQIDVIDAQPYIDRCLGCVGCVTACPSGVQYSELLMGYRSLSANERQNSFMDTVSRKLIVETLPFPNRFRRAVQTGRAFRPVQRAMPPTLSAMLDLLPDTLPTSEPLPTFYPAIGERRARVALLAGCVQRVLSPDINWATLRVLAENGVETVIPDRQGCCGSILMHIGDNEDALQMARNNFGVFPDDVDAIITNAAGCGSGMREYSYLFENESDKERALAFSAKVRDITVFLDELGFVPPVGFEKPVKVAYHDACHLLHAQGVHAAPRDLLASIPGVSVVELNDGGLCCGSAGTYNLEQPDIAEQLGQRKAQQIADTEAEVVVTGNIGCLTQIQTHLGNNGHALPIYHTINLLDQAYRQMPRP